MSAAADGRAEEMLRVSRMVMANQVASSPAAVYPADAKAAGIEGTVVLDVVVSAAGALEQVVVLSGPDKLRDAAKDAVSKWTYKPYLADGVATEVDTKVWVEFRLKDGASRDASEDATETVTDARVVQPSAIPAAPGSQRAAAPKVGPVHVRGGIVVGRRLHGVDPIYPYAAKKDHITGAVVMHAVISKAGMIENLEVISGPMELRDAALTAVKQWTYQPYLLNGAPTEVDTQITVNFQIGTSGPTNSDLNSGGMNGHQIGPH